MGILDSWREATDRTIATTLSRTAHTASTAGPFLDEVTGPMLDASRGGKRLRALLLLASHRAHRGASESAAIHVAAAIELFQTAALLHDDVLDDSSTRRGMPAAHRRIGALHAQAGWLGASDAYGAAGGILAGDLALMACQRALVAATSSLDAATGPAVGEMFVDMADLVTAGQYADMRAAAQPVGDIASQHDDIVAVMRSKTASYTCEHPLALGAAIAGADDDAVAAMRAIGIDLGIAFQLRDDLLGLTGEPDVTGKPAGDDIAEGKRTLVLWRAWSTTDDRGREVIAHALGDRDAPVQAIADAVAAILATDAVAWCEREIARRAEHAADALGDVDIDPDGASLLRGLVDRAVRRTA